MKAPDELKKKYLKKLAGVFGMEDIFKPSAETENVKGQNSE